jgi:predicted polyphosphate/ATP-dependent NAD kinase
VWYLPDRHDLLRLSAEGVPGVELIAALQQPTDTPEDTLRATRAMVDAGVRVLVTHGGDGTNRLVAMRAGDVPLLPIAAGTNNVFPYAVEATAAGFAAGVMALASVPLTCLMRHKRIRVQIDDREGFAVVDAAVLRDETVASRAVWDPERVIACMLTRAAPGAVGLSGLAGALLTVQPTEPVGAYVEMGPGTRIVVLITPGRTATAEIRSVRTVSVGECVEVGPLSGTVALDGERELSVRDQVVRLTLEANGPWVVDVTAVLAWAQRNGAFRVNAAD